MLLQAPQQPTAPIPCVDIAGKLQQNFRMDRKWTFLLIVVSAIFVARPVWGGQHNRWFISVSRYNDVPQPPCKSVEIGNFYLRKGAYRGALSRFREAVGTDPDYAPAYLGLGKVYEKMGHNRRALEAYETYLNDLPSDREAKKAKGVHEAIGRLKRQLAAGEARSSPSRMKLSSRR